MSALSAPEVKWEVKRDFICKLVCVTGVWSGAARVSPTRSVLHIVRNNGSSIQSRNRCIIPPSLHWGIRDEREVDGEWGYEGAEPPEVMRGWGWGGWSNAQRREHQPAHEILIQTLRPCLLPWIAADVKQPELGECVYVCVCEGACTSSTPNTKSFRFRLGLGSGG